MPPTATIEEIKAYQDCLEKNKIEPDTLPDCPVCNSESRFFKIHAYRERVFLVIIKMVIKSMLCPLARFACPGCGKTFTFYPDFALPNKHYTRQTIMGLSERYVTSEEATLSSVISEKEEDGAVPEYPDGKKSLSPSTVYRWIESLCRLKETTYRALAQIRLKDPDTDVFRSMVQLSVPGSKYESRSRMICLLGCLKLFTAETFFKATFKISIFTDFARGCGFT